MKRIDDWAEAVVFGSNGPQPQIFNEDNRLKVILAGLNPGQRIPIHPEGSSVYYFLEGRGTMHVDGEAVPVEEGVTIVMAEGAKRGLEAETRLVFLAAVALP
jgi:quercetin dioxygenase-like cupin family protein